MNYSAGCLGVVVFVGALFFFVFCFCCEEGGMPSISDLAPVVFVCIIRQFLKGKNTVLHDRARRF